VRHFRPKKDHSNFSRPVQYRFTGIGIRLEKSQWHVGGCQLVKSDPKPQQILWRSPADGKDQALNVAHFM
jgi:hypothetical protein